MKVEVFIDTQTHLNVPWPDGTPLPSTGDEVLFQLAQSGALAFTVESKFFGVGTGIDGQPLMSIRIKGREAAATP